MAKRSKEYRENKTKRGWHTYRTDLTSNQAKIIIKRLIDNGKVWGKTVTVTNEYNVHTVWTKKG